MDSTNEKIIYHPNDTELSIYDSELHEVIGEPGTFKFSISKQNKHYPEIKMHSVICVYKNNTLFWRGYITEFDKDVWGNLRVVCVEDIAIIYNIVWYYLSSSSTNVTAKTRNFIFDQVLTELRTRYPALNIVTGNLSPDSTPTRRFMKGAFNYWNMGELVDTYKGSDCFLNVRRENGNSYLDSITIDQFGNSNQTITFGENLLDYAETVKTNEFYNYLYLEASYTQDDGKIISENLKFINQESIDKYGRYDALVELTTEDDYYNRRSIGTNLVDTHCQINYAITVTALDLSLLNANVDGLSKGDLVHVIAEPYDVDMYYRIVEVTTYLQEPEKNTYSLSVNLLRDMTLTDYTKVRFRY